MKINILLLLFGCNGPSKTDDSESVAGGSWTYVNRSVMEYACGPDIITSALAGDVVGTLSMSVEDGGYILDPRITDSTYEFDSCEATADGLICFIVDNSESGIDSNLQVDLEVEWFGNTVAAWREHWRCDGECTEFDYYIHPAHWEGEGPKPVYPCTMDVELELSASE